MWMCRGWRRSPKARCIGRIGAETCLALLSGKHFLRVGDVGSGHDFQRRGDVLQCPVIYIALASPETYPGESCARGTATGVVSILAGGFLGTVGGTAFGVNHPIRPKVKCFSGFSD